MKKLGFNEQEDFLGKEDYYDFLTDLKENVIIRYKDENSNNDEIGFKEGKFLDVFADTDITDNIESVFVLTILLTKRIRKIKNSDIFFENLFFGADDEGSIKNLLSDTESFLKRLIALLYPTSNIPRTIDKEKWTFAKYIELEYEGRQFINDRIKDYAYVIKEYKNRQLSHDVVSKYSITKSKKTRELVRNSVTCFVMMVVLDKFDEIYEVVQNKDIISDKIAFSDITKYVEIIKRKQKEALNKIYGIEEDNEVGLHAISEISLKPYSNINNDIEKESHVLLAGESGTGKSTLLAKMVYNDILRWDENKELPLPVLVELKKFSAEYKNNFLSFVVGQIKNEVKLTDSTETQDLIHNYIRQLFNAGKVVLYIDGLNELPLHLGETRHDAIRGLIDLSKDYENCRFVVTSRIKDMGLDEEEGYSSYGDLISKGSIGNFKRFDLLPFDKKQVEKQIESYLNARHGDQNNNRQATKIAGKIKNNKIEDLAKNPLQLILIIRHFDESNNNRTLSVSNRSQLLIELTNDITKIKFVNPSDDKPKRINEGIKKILLMIAEQQYQNKDNQGFSLESIEALCKGFIGNSLDKRWTIERLLGVAVTFGILENTEDVYNFRHDSWREHFQAYSFVKRIENELIHNQPINDIINIIWNNSNHFKNSEVYDLLRHIFEIIEKDHLVAERSKLNKSIREIEKKKSEIIIKIGNIEKNEEFNRFKLQEYELSNLDKLQDLDRIYNLLKTDLINQNTVIEGVEDNYLHLTAVYRKFLNLLSYILLGYENGLSILSYATATMASFDLDDKDNNFPLPKKIVEREIMKIMDAYKNAHPEGISSSKVFTEDFNKTLKPIFEQIAMTCGEELLERLLDLYWMNIWLSIWDKGSLKVKTKQDVLTGVLLAKCEKPSLLFYTIFKIYQKLCCLREIEKANKVERVMMRLITQMNDSDVIDIVTNFLTTSKDDPVEKAQKRRLAPKLLLGLKDADSMFKSFEDREILKGYKFDTTIHLKTVENLLEKFNDLRMQEFLIGSKDREGLIETLPQNDEDQLSILSYAFLRYDKLKEGCKKRFLNYLISEKGQTVISKHHELLDLIPLDEAKRIYYYELTNYNSIEGLYRTNLVNYTLFRKDISDKRHIYTIAIPQTLYEDIVSCDIEIIENNNHIAETICTGDYSISEYIGQKRALLLIEWSRETPIYIPHEGKLRFTYKGNVITQSFKHLKDLVRLNHPELYHASICMNLIEELEDYDDFNEMFYFFKEKSCLEVFMDRFYTIFFDKTKKQPLSHNWDLGEINYCALTAKDSHIIRLFSPAISKIQQMCCNGMFSIRDFKKGAKSTGYECRSINNFPEYEHKDNYEINHFKILEKNGRLGNLNRGILNRENKHLFGFIEGVVQKKQNGLNIIVEQLKIRSNDPNKSDQLPLSFDIENNEYNDKSDYENGDKVIFFPVLTISNNKYKAALIEKTT